jgi:hypothetical protein
LSRSEYAKMMERPCDICGVFIPRGSTKPGRGMNVDHDHSSGKVRGTLCVRCNLSLGNWGDNPVLLLRAVEYLLRGANS